MKRNVLIVSSAVLLGTVVGCGLGTPPHVEVSGLLIRNGATYTPVDLTLFGPDRLEVEPDTVITTSNYVRLHIKGNGPHGNTNYDVLFGPDPSVGGSTSAEIDSSTSDFMLLTPGWALLRGDMPMGRTTRTVTCANGTTYIVQIVTGSPPTDRVYLTNVDGSEVGVSPSRTGATQSLDSIDEYAENSDDDGPVSTPTTVPASGALREFLQRVETVATNLNMWP